MQRDACGMNISLTIPVNKSPNMYNPFSVDPHLVHTRTLPAPGFLRRRRSRRSSCIFPVYFYTCTVRGNDERNTRSRDFPAERSV